MLTKDALDTPALCIDLEKLDANMCTVVDQCRQAGVGWRPHMKCHKSVMIARGEVDAGALGVTCAKLGEADIMAQGGIKDILIANLIVGPTKIARLAMLCRISDIMVCVDHPLQVRPLGNALAGAPRPLRVLVEVDIGMHRVGVAPGKAAVQLAQFVAQTSGLSLQGVMGYEGHLLQIQDPEEKRSQINAALDQLVDTADQLRAASLPCPIVSCGGTGSYQYSIHHPGITEVQAGGAIFMDEFYRTKCHVQGLENALTVLSTVVSCPTPRRVVIDAGRKTLDSQICMPRVLGHPELQVDYLSAEHGVLKVASGATPPGIGQRLELVPGYVDFTTVLHDEFHTFRHGLPCGPCRLQARGAVR